MIGIKDQYFGTEIEMTGITRQRAAEVVAEMFGTEDRKSTRLNSSHGIGSRMPSSA